MEVFRQVLGQLTAYIDQNELRPGDRLPADRELVATFQVSRPLVQQALKALEALGRVTIVHGLGTFVADNGHRVAAGELLRGVGSSPSLSDDLVAIRALVEKEVIRSAYAHDRTGLLAELQRVLDEQRRELARQPDEASLDLHFEAAFGRFCDNVVLSRLQAIVHSAWLQTQIDEDTPLADRFELHEDHREILEALDKDDLDLALRIFDQHLSAICGRGKHS
jgi:GntR family transcriptional repressor for pyruvate dehydrogenase complex